MPIKKSNQRLLKQITSKPKMPALATITALCNFLFDNAQKMLILVIVTTTQQPNAHWAERLDK
jgi:ABC-type polysaccharide/polyol phosphate export permease